MVTPFCIIGGHAYSAPTGTVSEGASLPEDWYMTRARFDRERQIWYEDPSSPAKICHCGEHQPDPPREV